MMDTMERDPVYIAEQVKLIRKMHRLTQENLALSAGLSTRTIEKVESGRHRPDEQTLRSIARAMQLDVGVFDKPSAEQEQRQRAALLRAQRKTIFATIRPVRTASEFLTAFEQRDAFRIDTLAVTEDPALEVAAGLADWIDDCGDIWNVCSRSQRVEYAREFGKLCQQAEAAGYVCYMGSHRQQLVQTGRPRLIFSVGIMTVLPKGENDDPRYAMVELEGAWETVEEDRVDLGAFG